ncbi:protein FAR1-RELATED SEQUENCE 11-like [Lactuca sativa]|uniref:Protein FAR1-RELATED SEQUENCE n=1 Tax=Lactuca sativa TaxID=4236 RepID=A0A9R1VQR6_LACSA|nr:protein FAR1-RELATED SEQUENCE 11-like [Lactuca sativa]KAJ0209744.1 hypothetical protein LSAT_V11C400192030 [Lactuca sativa]
MRVMELEMNVKHGELSFLKKDVYNLFTKNHKLHSQNDAREFLEYCKSAKSESLNFQYAFTLDSENRLEHIFWCDTHCFELYQKYGDIVVFDTTYKVNSYDMPFDIFVGIDNHGRTTLLGCALLLNKKLKTFEWLFKNFVQLMKKSPKTILTDQDPWMKQAIETEMPYTKHAFCIWHITTKFSSWFTSVLKDEYSSWCTEFYNLYKLDSVEEFEQQWPLVIAKYNLEKNKHVIALYQIKTFWVPSYLRDFFFGGMMTTGRSESINSFIKKFISSHTCLREFIRQIDLAIEDVGHKQMHDGMLAKYQESHFKSLSPLEKQGYQVLTPFAFKKFQEQFAQAIQYSVREENDTSFIVKHYKAARCHQVVWDGKMAKCTCKNFEFVGILCRHILSVFLRKDCFEIPSSYWLSRWSREEAQFTEISLLKQEGNFDVSSSCGNNSHLETNAIELVQCPIISKTKGRLKQKRMRSGKELARQVKRCRLCKSSSHNFSTCPEREDDNSQHVDKTKKLDMQIEDFNPIFHFKC